MRGAFGIIPYIPERAFLCRRCRELNDLAVGCSEKHIIALADFLVDVLCQLLSPFSRVVSEEHLTVRLDIAHTRVADLAYAALALPALRSVIGGGRSVIGSGLCVIACVLRVIACVLRGAGKGVVPHLLKLLGVLHHGLCLGAPCLHSLKRPAQLGRELCKPFPDLCKQTGVFFCHHLRHLRVLKHHLAAVGYDLLGCVLHGYQAALLVHLLLRQRLNICPALYEVLHHEVLKLSVCLGVVLSEVMRQLVRSSQQYSRLLRRLGCPGVYVEVHRPVAVESVRALVLAVLLLGLVQYHVHAHGLGHRLEYAQLRITHHVLCRRPVCHALILHALETDCTLAALARDAVLYAAGLPCL